MVSACVRQSRAGACGARLIYGAMDDVDSSKGQGYRKESSTEGHMKEVERCRVDASHVKTGDGVEDLQVYRSSFAGEALRAPLRLKTTNDDMALCSAFRHLHHSLRIRTARAD